MKNYILYSIPEKAHQLNEIIYIYSIMDVAGQLREGELTPDQLEIGKVYRLESYHRPTNTRITAFLARFKRIYEEPVPGMEFTIVNFGTHPRYPLPEDLPNGEYNVDVRNNPTHPIYYRFFQTAADIVEQRTKQQALQQVFAGRLPPIEAHFLSDGWFATNTRKGGRKYKTRQTKLRRKNRTRKNRRRTRRR